MHQVHNDDRDIGAGSSGFRGRIGTDLIDLQGSGRLLGRGIDAAAGEHVRANFSLHRRAGYEKSQKRPTWQRWYSVAESAISVHPFSSRWRDATLAHLPRAKGHRRSWNRAFEKLCVCVCVPPLSASLLEINCVPRYEESYFRNVDFPCRVIDG